MKRALVTSVFFLSSILIGFSQELIRQVVASSGNEATVGYSIFQYTIGEPIVATLSVGNLLLTQGFEQPEVAGPTKAPEAPFVSDLIVYPNPASDQVNLEFDLRQDGRVVFMLVNNAGQVVFSKAIQMLSGRLTYTLSLSRYASGLYYIVIKTGYRTYTEKLIIQ
ncbi:T9SS type A sorting domain-containing protein [Parapedobacter defluvii]|uniref:T9SS type A sorting domain-containing protein n=1 Tax=Parapedobacter defluvii TaxID=2045106 RepID=UPI000FC24E47|nr:MAG: T9SS C-terminal target domain-containing protein [Parapedobacter sp.]